MADAVARRALAVGFDEAKQRPIIEAVPRQVMVISGHEKMQAIDDLPSAPARITALEQAMSNIADAVSGGHDFIRQPGKQTESLTARVKSVSDKLVAEFARLDTMFEKFNTRFTGVATQQKASEDFVSAQQQALVDSGRLNTEALETPKRHVKVFMENTLARQQGSLADGGEEKDQEEEKQSITN